MSVCRRERDKPYVEELKIDLRRGVGIKQLVASPTEPNVYVDRDGREKRDLIDQLEALLVKEGSKEDKPTFAKMAQTYIEQTNFTREQIKKQTLLGSRLIDNQSQNKTVAARAMADRKTFGHLS